MAYEAPERVREILKNLPTKPGVYLHKDKNDVVIYVGKARNLRNRVRSYFHKNVDSTKTERLRQRVEDIEIITVGSELEALLLENTLIKKYKPHYNIRLKDDKRYPYIKINWKSDFPKVTVTRRMVRDGSRYFGPYTSVWALHETLDTLRRIFPYLTCDRVITGKDPRACLYFDIKLCNGPCIGAVNREEYRAMISSLIDFLNGKSDVVQKQVTEKMMVSAENLDFENAARYRDQLKAIDKIVAKQKVYSAANADQDVVAFAREDGDACVQIFFIRHGKMIGREYFLLENTEGEKDNEVLQDFITQFYDTAAHVPREVILQSEVDEVKIIEQWLRQKRGTRVTIEVPKQGKKKELVKMAVDNAGDTLATLRQQWASDRAKHTTALNELKESLKLPRQPSRIECYDIAHTGGKHTVGSMIVFVQGAPRKADYRKFNVQSVGNDDYGAMKEVLTRRFERYRETLAGELHDTSKIGKIKKETAWALLPDLLLVDGGKGQLRMAREVLEAFDLVDEVPVASLAKREEEVFIANQPYPILLPRRSQGLFLVQRARDEAHRFANSSHRKRRGRAGVASILDGVPGVGPKRRKLLLEKFGSLEEIRSATAEELGSVPGIPLDVAEAIKANLD